MNKRLKNRLWLVTCLALAIITTYTIYRYYCVHRIGDSDFYWHIMLGKNAISGLSADDSLVWPNSIYQTSYTNYSLLSDIILYKLSCIREDETFGALVYMLITAFITSFIVFAGWGRNVIKKISSSARSTITRIDMYDKELLQDMNAIKGKVSVTDGTPDYTEAVLEKYNIDMVTLCRGDSMMLIGYMSQKQNWRITYQDSAYVIFQKAQE